MTARPRGPIDSSTAKTTSACGKVYTDVGISDDGEFLELRPRLGKSGECQSLFFNVIGRLGSLALQHGCPIEEIWEQLQGYSCDQSDKETHTCLDAIALGLEAIVRDEEGEDDE